MGTITICIDDEIERQFRQVARETLGEKKGYLGKATAEAIENWVQDKEQDAIAQEALRLMSEDWYLGKRLYKTRQDIHDRNTCTD